MRIIKGLQFMLKSRGVKKGIKRLNYIIKRFGFTPTKQIKFIQHYIDILKKHNINGTFFVPGIILKRYFKNFQNLKSDNIEWGIHSDTHTDLSRLDYANQVDHINNSIKLFNQLNKNFKGFRAPYLKTNIFTQKIINNTNKFLYDSSKSILWDTKLYNKGNSKSFEWIIDFYKPALNLNKNAVPELLDSIVEIPVSLPDDDILVDREEFDINIILLIWSNMLDICYKERKIFVLQLHPERIFELENVLDELIKRAKQFNPPIWITTLEQVANWKKNNTDIDWPYPYQGSFCITGDIDSITLWDFFERVKKW